MANATKIRGEELMIFYTDSLNHKRSIAFATNHTMTIQASTSSDSNKDEGGFWEAGDIQSMNWSISTENLNCGDNFDTLFDIMVAGKPIDVVFGFKKENQRSLDNLPYWTPDNWNKGSQFVGKATISNLQLNAPSGENSSLTADFTGVGELKRLDHDPSEDPVNPDSGDTGYDDSTSGDTEG